MFDANLDDKVEWNGNFSREVLFLDFQKSAMRGTWKNANKRFRANFPTVSSKGQFSCFIEMRGSITRRPEFNRAAE